MEKLTTLTLVQADRDLLRSLLTSKLFKVLDGIINCPAPQLERTMLKQAIHLTYILDRLEEQ